jgi:hypothetical protein
MKKLIVAFCNFVKAPKNELERIWKEVVVAPFWALNYNLHAGTEKYRDVPLSE